MTRRMFAGASTPGGFISFFNHIMPLEKAEKRYFLKGSSGSGKSTFMKKIAAGLEAEGFDTERFHCANDAESLDGVAIRKSGLCIIDGTAPHVCDPEVPAAVDEIIDFAQFIDAGKISKYTGEIKMLLRQKKQLTEMAGVCLNAAGNVYIARKAAFEAALNKPVFIEFSRETVNVSLKDFEGRRGAGSDRKMFASAVTPDGVKTFSDSVLDGFSVCGVNSEYNAGTGIFLSALRYEANARGINTESFYNPVEPTNIDFLLIPESRAAFAAYGGRFGYNGEVSSSIDFSECFDARLHEEAKSVAESSGAAFESLLDETVSLMKASREFHGKIEEIYINCIDFDAVEKMTERILRELYRFCLTCP